MSNVLDETAKIANHYEKENIKLRSALESIDFCCRVAQRALGKDQDDEPTQEMLDLRHQKPKHARLEGFAAHVRLSPDTLRWLSDELDKLEYQSGAINPARASLINDLRSIADKGKR